MRSVFGLRRHCWSFKTKLKVNDIELKKKQRKWALFRFISWIVDVDITIWTEVIPQCCACQIFRMCLNGVEKIGTLKIYCLFTFILFLILSSFLTIPFFSSNSIFLKMLKQMLQESLFSTFVSWIPVNLNQYREAVSVLNNCNIAIWNFCTIWYSQSFRNCSIFIFFKVIFICSSYLFTLFQVFHFKVYLE